METQKTEITVTCPRCRSQKLAVNKVTTVQGTGYQVDPCICGLNAMSMSEYGAVCKEIDDKLAIIKTFGIEKV